MCLGLAEFRLEHAIQQTGEFCVHTLIARNKLIGCREARHKAAFLEPKDGTESTAEEDALYGCKCHQPGREISFFGLHPLNSPLGLLLDARNRVNGLEKFRLFGIVLM